LSLRIKKRIGKQEEFYKTIRFRVEKSFYETWTFYLIVLIIGWLVVLLFSRLRNSFLIRERNKLKKQVIHQIEDLSQTNNKLNETLLDLKSSNEQLEYSDEIRAKMMSIFVHDLKAPLKFLTFISKNIISSKESIEKDEIQQIADNIYITSLTSLKKIEQFLAWQTNNQNQLTVDFLHFPIKECIDDIEFVFSVFSKMNQNSFEIKGNKKLIVYSDKELLTIILWNIVDNANKYTFKGQIRIEIIDNIDVVTIQIVDTGRGIKQEDLTVLRAMMKQRTIGEINKNIGLSIVHDFIELLNGTFEIFSDGDNKGTSVFIHIPKQL
jgi:signal transduction histidine kinase